MRQILNSARIFAICAPLMSFAGPATAHPHVWISIKSEVAFTTEGLVKGVQLTWMFDQAYAEATLDGLDKDGDGIYSEAEIRALTKANMVSLEDWHYLTVMRFNDQRQEFGEVGLNDIEHIWENNELSLRFFLTLKTPVDARKGDLVMTVFDPSYFIALEYANDDAVGIMGQPPAGCAPKLLPVSTDAELEHKRAFLATKGKDWMPPPDQEFGEDLAQRLVISCAQ
jgi:ABC-type uncharacterized transport system substrate-binding protein